MKIKVIKPGLYMELGLINTIYEFRKTLLGIERGEKSPIGPVAGFLLVAILQSSHVG
jgi:hypothetical protein